MNNANISSPNTKNKNTENPIENTTNINNINSDKGGVNLDFIIINIFGIVIPTRYRLNNKIVHTPHGC